MTNEQFIRSLPLKDLASIVIRHQYEEDIDYDWDENPFSWGVRTVLVTSDGVRFYEDDYEAVLEHECWWLQQEAVAVTKQE